MRFTYEHLELNNVLTFKADMANKDKVGQISDKLLDEGLYTTCPKVYQVTDNPQEFNILLAMNREISDVPSGVDYIPLVSCDKCIYTRYLDFDTDYDSMFSELQKFAADENVEIKSVYLVQIPIPGGTVTDVYAEV